MACRLIINADDFGASESVNEAIVHLHDSGIVTSTSLLVGGSAAGHAVGLARRRPHLPVGLHLAVTHGPSVLPHSRIPLLADEAGRYSDDCLRTALAVTFRPAARQQLREEFAAQVRRFDEWGLPWSHVDFHVHMCLTPTIWEAGLRLCESLVSRIRVPEDDPDLHGRLFPAEASWARRSFLPFRLRCPAMRRDLARHNIGSALKCFGFFKSGRLDAEYLAAWARHLPNGDFELHCHPDCGSEAGRREVEALTSAEFREALEERGICLVRGFDLDLDRND